MDFRNRYLIHTIRTIFGALMLYSGAFGVYLVFNQSMIPAEGLAFTQVLIGSGIFQMIKVTEAVAGGMLLANFRPALATLFLAPVAIGIFIVNAVMTPAFLPVAIVVALLTAYLGYAYWPKYRQLFVR